MSTRIIELKKVMTVYRGDYDSTATYQYADVVKYNGSSYALKVESAKDVLPIDTTKWQLLVEKPVKNVDYFTQTDKQEMIESITEDAESEFNQNVTKKTTAFNNNASNKTTDFNSNATNKTNAFNTNCTNKTDAFDTNTIEKTNAFNTNSTNKTTDYNNNASDKTDSYNANHTSKLSAYNENASTKLNEYNSNAVNKTTEFDSNATNKTTTFNTNAINKTNDFNTNAQNKTEEFNFNKEKLQKDFDYYKTTFNALPKVTGEGTDITLNNTADTPLTLGFKASESTQNTTRGVNLFNHYLYPVSGTYGGITITNNNDGSFTLNGTCTTANTSIEMGSNPTIQQYVNEGPVTQTAYYISGTCTKGTSSSARTVIRLNYDTGTDKMIPLQNLSTERIISKTNPKDSKEAGWSWRVVLDAGDIFDNFTIKYQLEKGDTATNWEQYTGGQPSPSPDFSQDIQVVEGDNEVVVETKNLFDKDNANIITGSFSADSLTIASSQNAKTLYIKCNPNTTYTISKIESNRFRVITTEIIPDVSTPIIRSDYKFNDTGTSINITTSSSANYLCVYYYLNETDTISEQSILNSIQIEIGNVATSYIDHEGQNYPINLGVVNLFDKDNQDFKEGYILNDNGEEQTSNISKYSLNYTSVRPNTTYTLQGSLFGTGNSMRLYLYDENKDFISRTGQIGLLPYTFTTNSSTYYLRFQVGLSGYDGDTVQLEEGSVAHSYSPYGQEPIEMCNINNYADEFFKNVPECEYYDITLENGKWYKLGKIGKTTFSNYQPFTVNAVLNANVQYLTTEINNINPSINDNSLLKSNYVSSFGGTTPTFKIRFNIPHTYLGTSSSSTSQEAKQALLTLMSGKLIEFYYPLGTPTKTLLPDTLQTQLDDTSYAMAYQEQTNISQVNEDRPFIISASTVLDLNTLVSRVAVLESEV